MLQIIKTIIPISPVRRLRMNYDRADSSLDYSCISSQETYNTPLGTSRGSA